MEHNLKINKEFFPYVLDRTKPFEIRKNDRDFCIGDIIFLNEWDDKILQFTGRSISGKIT
ncbi:DUF3850 domain-containing protein [Ornithinibacillus bavariensis]|uniref:DUF3850 domain-containing protein n=1 Tax=Ornithinibacillus bavariensis TaxID=545502 RepID=A0A919X9G2_9BACI|nr:DUF3850 domain-containing protein [Ornithinibacillus bavariensis]GIO28294.1 hypothetical protein J43TS3_29050 [Ornithinibacillus bavariensis]